MTTKPKRQKPHSKPGTIDEYLAGVHEPQRTALQRLRRSIRAAAPNLQEGISYGIPAFRLNGRFLVGIGAATHHCSFYLGSTLQQHRLALNAFETSKGTIRFQPDQPLPAALVRKLITARVRQNAGKTFRRR